MGKRIIWQPKPIQQMRALEQYFVEELGTIQAYDAFLEKLEKKLSRISNYPESGHYTGRTNIRYFNVDNHRSIFYRIWTDRLQIILLWDARQYPQKNPFTPKR